MDHSADRADPEAEAGNDGQDDAATPESRSAQGRAEGSRGSDSRGVTISASAVAPFIERAEASAPHRSRSRRDAFFIYGSHAALALCVAGFAWAAGTHLFGRAEPDGKASQDSVERAEMAQTTQKMVEDMRALKANVEALRSSMAQNQNAQSLRALEKSMDALKARLEAAKAETGASIAELSGKVEHMQREPNAKLQQVVERLDRIERQTAAPLAASATPAAPAPGKAAAPNRTQVAMVEPKPKLDPLEGQKRPQLIRNWVVRDVYDGIALLENAQGSLEVALGETIPGAGTVKSIERRAGGWIVITNRGLVDSARGAFFP